ncbi:MAG: TonB-dependent receptor [Bryobacteraceae bacterium]|nr:TonB-dependent receptor [Bryobacteraceae bacterium]
MNKKFTRYCLFTLTLAAACWAQRDLGTIVGTVTDPQGAAVSNAKVTITEDATGLVYEVVSGSGGEYIRPALKAGTYSIQVEAAGFKRAAQRNVVLTAGDRTGVNITLSLGEISQTVEILADSPLLQTESTVLGANVTSKQVVELPLGGQRTFTFLARLSPGVVPAEPGARDAVGGGFSANGVRSNGQNNFLLNGVDNNVNVIDFLNQTAYVVGPSVEAIGEIRVMTNGYNAEYGRGAGGVVNVTLKSGSNQIHGSVFEYFQNAALNANRWENNRAGKPNGGFGQNQFGAAVGGPLIKNRTFWFADYQGTRVNSSGGAVQNLGSSGFFTIPDPAYKNGDFSRLLTNEQIGTDALGRPIVSGQIFDPATTRTGPGGASVRDPFPGNRIPLNRLDPVSLKILALFPTPNAGSATGFPQNNYFVTTKGRQTVDQYDVRIDHKISDNDSIFGSLSWSDSDKLNEQPLPGALDATYFNSNAEITLARNAMLSYTRVWTPSIITETRAAYTRLVTSRLQADPDVDQFKAFGIGGYNPTTTLNGGLPSTNIERYSGFGASDWLPSKEYSNVWDFIQNVSINKGTHAMKFGAEYRPIKFPFFQVPSPHGNWTFDRRSTSAPIGNYQSTGDAYASFALGNVYNGQISTNNFISSQKSAWAFFAQDDWKVTSKLTFNYGLRYERFTPIDEKFGRQSNFVLEDLTLYIPKGKDQDAPLPPNFATQFPQVKVSRGQVPSTLIESDKWNFGPRVGFAYNALSRTVIRAGYGIFYGGEENQGGNPNRGEAVPFNATVKLDHPDDVFGPNPFFSGGVQGGFPSNVFSLPAPVEFRSVATNFRNPLVHKWNFAIQREFGGNTALEVSYVGNHQAHQLLQPDPNACANSPIPNLTCNSRRPYPNIGNIQGTATFGFGNYHGMTAKLEKRYSNGLNFTSAYTYGHALATSGTTLSGSDGFGNKDPRNLSLNYSSAAWDIRHSSVTNFLYDLPFGRGKRFGGDMSRLADTLVGGWQVNGILTLRTGSPFTLRSDRCVASVDSCFPDLVFGKNPNNAPSGGRRPEMWFDTSAVNLIPAPGTAGNLGLQTNRNPGQKYMDFSLFKHFKFTERITSQLRAEAFNIGNTPQFGHPGHNIQNTDFGVINGTQSGSERKMQMALRILF